MDTRKYYSSHETLQLARYLNQLAGQGAPIDYEIRVDGLLAVPRTNDPENFFDYQEFLKDDTREMTVLFFKGASRVSDKHVLVLSDKPLAQAIPTFEERLDSALEQDRSEVLRKIELDKLKGINEQQQRKIKKQKRKIKQLKQGVASAGSESAGFAKVLKDLATSPKVKEMFGGKEASSAVDLGALPDEMIIGYLKDYREQLGEQTFQELLGTMLTMAQRPELITQVRTFITNQTDAA